MTNQPAIVSQPYISIDIETTGLDDKNCQVLELAAVIDDWQTPLDRLLRYHCYVVHDQIVGEPYALAMNASILQRIADRHKPENREYNFLEPHAALSELLDFLYHYQMLAVAGRDKTIVAGKNFASFDDRFLQKLPHYQYLKFHHRTIDPGMLYWNPAIDTVPPDTKTCLERAGIHTEVRHDALNDALDVIRLIRTHFGVAI